MSWQVLITAGAMAKAGKQGQEKLRQASCRLVFPPKKGPLSVADLLPLLPETDAVVASLEEYSDAVLGSPNAAKLKIIARWGAGYDSIDLAAAVRQGIVVTYTPGLLDDAVADYTFALLLALARRVHEGYLAMLSNEWKPKWGCDVAGKTLGIIGLGHIGLAVARRATGFNMRLLARSAHPSTAAKALGVRFVSLEQLLAESDFVSLHAALTPETRGLLGQEQLRSMKPGALLINSGRGALVEELALARALREGWIGGAALDVFTSEPLSLESPLRSAPNLLLSPHQASLALDTGERVSLAAAQAVLDLMDGRRPQNVLNPAVFDSPALRSKVI